MQTELAHGALERATHKEIVKAMQKIKSGKATGQLQGSVKMIAASDKIGVKVMINLCQYK